MCKLLIQFQQSIEWNLIIWNHTNLLTNYDVAAKTGFYVNPIQWRIIVVNSAAL